MCVGCVCTISYIYVGGVAWCSPDGPAGVAFRACVFAVAASIAAVCAVRSAAVRSNRYVSGSIYHFFDKLYHHAPVRFDFTHLRHSTRCSMLSLHLLGC